jgi:hypothetical protein
VSRLFFAVIQHSWYYYVAGFIAGLAMIVRGIQMMLRNREQKERQSRQAQEAEFQDVKEQAAEEHEEPGAAGDAEATPDGEAVTHYVRPKSMPVPAHKSPEQVRRNRTLAWALPLAGAAVLVIVAVILIVVFVGGGATRASTPADAFKALGQAAASKDLVKVRSMLTAADRKGYSLADLKQACQAGWVKDQASLEFVNSGSLDGADVLTVRDPKTNTLYYVPVKQEVGDWKVNLSSLESESSNAATLQSGQDGRSIGQTVYLADLEVTLYEVDVKPYNGASSIQTDVGWLFYLHVSKTGDTRVTLGSLEFDAKSRSGVMTWTPASVINGPMGPPELMGSLKKGEARKGWIAIAIPEPVHDVEFVIRVPSRDREASYQMTYIGGIVI